MPIALFSIHGFLEKKFLPLWSSRNLIASGLFLTFLPEISLSYLMFCKHGLPLKNLSFLVKIRRLVCRILFKLLMFNQATPYSLKGPNRLEHPTVRDDALSKSMPSTLSKTQKIILSMSCICYDSSYLTLGQLNIHIFSCISILWVWFSPNPSV